MAGWTIPLGAAPSVGPAMFRDADTAVFIATTDGAVLSCRLLDGAVRKHGSGHTAPIAALPAPDGLGIYVVEAAGRILEVYREEADAAQAVLVADLQQTVIAARLDARGAALFAVGEGDGGSLHRVDLASGSASQLAANLGAIDETIKDLVVDDANDRVVLLRSGAGGAHLVIADLAALTEAAVPLAAPADAQAMVLASDAAGGLIVAGAGGDLARVGFDGQTLEAGPSLAVSVRALLFPKTRWLRGNGTSRRAS
jgi:hypothetical protein